MTSSCLHKYTYYSQRGPEDPKVQQRPTQHSPCVRSVRKGKEIEFSLVAVVFHSINYFPSNSTGVLFYEWSNCYIFFIYHGGCARLPCSKTDRNIAPRNWTAISLEFEVWMKKKRIWSRRANCKVTWALRLAYCERYFSLSDCYYWSNLGNTTVTSQELLGVSHNQEHDCLFKLAKDLFKPTAKKTLKLHFNGLSLVKNSTGNR